MKKITFLFFMLLSISFYAQECVERMEPGFNSISIFLLEGDNYSWGENEYGELGNGTTEPQETPSLSVMSGDWQEISHGWSHTIAIHNDGTLWAWGRNYFSQLGNDDNEDLSSPVQIGTADDWETVSAGLNHSLAIKTDGTLWGWGSNFAYELMNSDVDKYYTPFQIDDATDWKEISAGMYRSFAIKTDGTLWVRGRNLHGGLGIGETTVTISFEQVGNDNNWKTVYALPSKYTLAQKTDQTIWRWGEYLDTSGNTETNTPQQIGDDQWMDISSMYLYSIGIKTDGTLWQWGENYSCLDNENSGSAEPVQIGDDDDWIAVAAPGTNAYVLKDDHSLWEVDVFNCLPIEDKTPVKFIDCDTFSNQDFDADEIAFYPNPVQDNLHWKSPNQTDFVAYEIRNIQGKKVLSNSVEGNKVNLAQLKTGVYFIFLETAEGNFIKHKIIKK
ncbi:MAG: T9SS type A sorting domain-containing protein [Bacteroidota bacterium]